MKTVKQPHGGALKQVQKGEVLNPKGRGKGVPNTATRLQRLLQLTENLNNPITHEVEGFTVAEQLDLAQIIRARKGDTRAYNAILDRLEGKAKESIEVDASLNVYNKLTDDQLDKIIESKTREITATSSVGGEEATD